MTPETTNEPVVPKKPYATPELRDYGDVREMTQGGASSSVSDNGNNHKSF